jgi:hypothetical protein
MTVPLCFETHCDKSDKDSSLQLDSLFETKVTTAEPSRLQICNIHIEDVTGLGWVCTSGVCMEQGKNQKTLAYYAYMEF